MSNTQNSQCPPDCDVLNEPKLMPVHKTIAGHKGETCMTVTACYSHDGNINSSPVCLSCSNWHCVWIQLHTFSFRVHLLEVCLQVLFSMVLACNDIIISENTDSAPIALLLGVSQGCEHETSVSWALMLGSPRRLQLRHLSARLRRLPLLRLTRSALTGDSGTYNSCTC